MNLVSLFAQTPYYSQDIRAADDATAAGNILLTLLFMLITMIISYVITALLLARIFKKADVESWKAWVPVYNNWVLLELGGQKGYWAVLALIPLVNIVSAIFVLIAMYHIGLRFGKHGQFVLLAFFVPLVWYIWLAYDNSTWRGPYQLRSKKDPGTPTSLAEK